MIQKHRRLPRMKWETSWWGVITYFVTQIHHFYSLFLSKWVTTQMKLVAYELKMVLLCWKQRLISDSVTTLITRTGIKIPREKKRMQNPQVQSLFLEREREMEREMAIGRGGGVGCSGVCVGIGWDWRRERGERENRQRTTRGRSRKKALLAYKRVGKTLERVWWNDGTSLVFSPNFLIQQVHPPKWTSEMKNGAAEFF